MITVMGWQKHFFLSSMGMEPSSKMSTENDVWKIMVKSDLKKG